MKQMCNIADRGSKHHGPVNGPPGAWVHRREEIGRTVRESEQNLAAYDLARPANPDGCKSEWCRLKITVDRPGAHVLAPTGFFRDPKTGREDYPLAAGLAAPLDFTELPFTLSWAANPQSPEAKRRVGFVVTFPPEAEMPTPTGNQLNLEILVRATGAHGGDPECHVQRCRPAIARAGPTSP